MQLNKLFLSTTTALSVLALAACQDHRAPDSPAITIQNRSVTPVLAKVLPSAAGGRLAVDGIKLYSLLSSDDKLDQSPSFVFGGSADGAGIFQNPDGNYTVLVNNEDNFAVSRITLDPSFKPVKGEYILNSDGGTWRLCSATLVTPLEHGFGPLFLTSGESGQESRTHALPVNADAQQATMSREVSALGRWSAENAVPLPKTAYPGKTAIVIGDDDSDVNGGQVALYLTNTVGDLENGALHMLKRTDGNQREMDMTMGQKYDVEFVKIDNHKTLTGAQINGKVNELKAIKFGRVEDVDYRKGGGANGREVFFVVTGQNNTGVNADYSRSKYGRIYRLTLDASDPTKGKLEVVLNGDDRTGPANMFQDPDNICVTTNYAYIMEDPNEYGDEKHDAYVYQYELSSGKLMPILVLDHRRTETDAAKYNVGGVSKLGSWESSGMIDVSDVTGRPNTFMLGIQAHTWRDNKYLGVDGGSVRKAENQASQLILIEGLPR
ncbi:alkaline phosphatase PhoX [Spirosoma flavum]|uniref:Alkaline phosphatase PhoX n=1 Tax=Spirosoma flavum TaxID=2048557 RepID=A0ABW6AT24_9BACT